MSREMDWPTGRGVEAGSALVEGGLCADAAAIAAARDLSLVAHRISEYEKAQAEGSAHSSICLHKSTRSFSSNTQIPVARSAEQGLS